MVDPRLRLAFMQLVLEKSVSIEQAARRYGRHERAIRHWCWMAPISVRVAGGSRRVSLQLADLFAIGEHQALWDLLDGEVAQIVADAFDTYGMGAVLDSYAKKVGNAGTGGNRDVAAAGAR
jgi:hypothetical protein